MQDPCTRLRKYIGNVEHAFRSLKVLDPSCNSVVELARTYLEDSKYYMSKGDCITGLVTISYAEGLLDALRILELVEFEWLRRIAIEERIVMAAGSFDIIHPGHVEYLKWASSLGTKLFVVVARDSTYRRVKGIEPVLDEVSRLNVVSAIRYVYKALLGDESDILKPIEALRPHVIALGPDQGVDENWLRRELNRRGLKAEIVRMGKRVEGYSSSSIKRRLMELLKRLDVER